MGPLSPRARWTDIFDQTFMFKRSSQRWLVHMSILGGWSGRSRHAWLTWMRFIVHGHLDDRIGSKPAGPDPLLLVRFFATSPAANM
jgi:hypothetical protein